MEKFEQPPVSPEQELKTLFEADQKDRPMEAREIDWNVVNEHDAERLKRANALYSEYEKNPQEFTGEALYYLAFLFHHGKTNIDYERAFHLAKEAEKLGLEDAKELAMLAEDRLLLSQGKPQKWGTQELRSIPKESEEDGESRLMKSLKEFEPTVEIHPKPKENAYIIRFPFEEGGTTLRILLHDYSGADLVITNITTLPDSQKNQGFGSRAIQRLLDWAKKNNLTHIRAVQVQKPSESFWQKNGFIKDEEPNLTNDFIYNSEAK